MLPHHAVVVRRECIRERESCPRAAHAAATIVLARVNSFAIRDSGALTVHTHLEEQIFYPALANFDETSEIVERSYEEHQEVNELLSDLTGLSPTAEEWIELIGELRENLEHHIEEEEGELFPQAEELLGEERLEELGRQMEEIKSGAAATAGARKR